MKEEVVEKKKRGKWGKKYAPLKMPKKIRGAGAKGTRGDVGHGKETRGREGKRQRGRREEDGGTLLALITAFPASQRDTQAPLHPQRYVQLDEV